MLDGGIFAWLPRFLHTHHGLSSESLGGNVCVQGLKFGPALLPKGDKALPALVGKEELIPLECVCVCVCEFLWPEE